MHFDLCLPLLAGFLPPTLCLLMNGINLVSHLGSPSGVRERRSRWLSSARESRESPECWLLVTSSNARSY